jgi:hypothetical protein
MIFDGGEYLYCTCQADAALAAFMSQLLRPDNSDILPNQDWLAQFRAASSFYYNQLTAR